MTLGHSSGEVKAKKIGERAPPSRKGVVDGQKPSAPARTGVLAEMGLAERLFLQRVGVRKILGAFFVQEPNHFLS